MVFAIFSFIRVIDDYLFVKNFLYLLFRELRVRILVVEVLNSQSRFWRAVFLIQDSLPVNVLEERMLHDLSGTIWPSSEASRWISIK